jgi:hypothetical protein
LYPCSIQDLSVEKEKERQSISMANNVFGLRKNQMLLFAGIIQQQLHIVLTDQIKHHSQLKPGKSLTIIIQGPVLLSFAKKNKKTGILMKT